RGLQICTGTVCAGTSLNQTLSNINAYQVTTLNQQPLANQSFQVVQTPNGSGQSLLVQISDSNFQIITPVVQIISSLPYMGLTYAVAQCNIVSQSPAKFNSGASGTATVTVKNTGISGGCTAVANMPSPFYTPTSYTGSNGRFIAQGGQFTYSFPIYSSQAINNTSNGFTAPITFTVCSAASAGTCSTVQTTATENPVCGSGFTQAVNGSNCQPLITTTAPTTTIPQPNVCGGLFQPACNTTTVTTTIPVTCQPPSVFNQTLFNQGVNPPCWIPKGNGGDNTLYYIAGAIIVIAIIAFLASGGVKVKGGGGEGKRPVGRPRLDSMVG
ncbi:MAG: hypothetical protein KGJ89_05610, partial [Patescibacteria group bacterium]|nr:hypothetical protein [Patescibacteria group bacterium]